MKISHTILLAGVFVLVAEIIIFQANLQEYSDTVDEKMLKKPLRFIFLSVSYFLFLESEK